MLAIIIASMIANAFILLRCSLNNFYKLHRYDGQLLYIKATSIGVFSTAISCTIYYYMGHLDYIEKYLTGATTSTSNDLENLRALCIFMIFSGLLSFIYCLLERLFLCLKAWYNFRDNQGLAYYMQMAKIMLKHKILNDSPLDKLFFSSLVENKFLLITMSDRKVYVGRVISMGEPNEHQGADQEIAIVPVFSGYRDSVDLSVHLVTSYEEHEEVDEAFLVLKQDKIISACEFFESLHDKISKI